MNNPLIRFGAMDEDNYGAIITVPLNCISVVDIKDSISCTVNYPGSGDYRVKYTMTDDQHAEFEKGLDAADCSGRRRYYIDCLHDGV